MLSTCLSDQLVGYMIWIFRGLERTCAGFSVGSPGSEAIPAADTPVMVVGDDEVLTGSDEIIQHLRTEVCNSYPPLQGFCEKECTEVIWSTLPRIDDPRPRLAHRIGSKHVENSSYSALQCV